MSHTRSTLHPHWSFPILSSLSLSFSRIPYPSLYRPTVCRSMFAQIFVCNLVEIVTKQFSIFARRNSAFGLPVPIPPTVNRSCHCTGSLVHIQSVHSLSLCFLGASNVALSLALYIAVHCNGITLHTLTSIIYIHNLLSLVSLPSHWLSRRTL